LPVVPAARRIRSPAGRARHFGVHRLVGSEVGVHRNHSGNVSSSSVNGDIAFLLEWSNFDHINSARSRPPCATKMVSEVGSTSKVIKPELRITNEFNDDAELLEANFLGESLPVPLPEHRRLLAWVQGYRT